MKKFVYLMILSLALSACDNKDGDRSISELEKKVVQQALDDPQTSISFFMQKIESGANAKEQGVYIYGVAVAREKMGDKAEAINDYLSADALGNESARQALNRLHVSP